MILLPAQEGLVPAVTAILTEGVNIGLIVIVIALDVTCEGVAHAALDVKTHVTACPFVKEFVVNVGLLVPKFTPFTRH